jgi:hypothetical protein
VAWKPKRAGSAAELEAWGSALRQLGSRAAGRRPAEPVELVLHDLAQLLLHAELELGAAGEAGPERARAALSAARTLLAGAPTGGRDEPAGEADLRTLLEREARQALSASGRAGAVELHVRAEARPIPAASAPQLARLARKPDRERAAGQPERRPRVGRDARFGGHARAVRARRGPRLAERGRARPLRARCGQAARSRAGSAQRARLRPGAGRRDRGPQRARSRDRGARAPARRTRCARAAAHRSGRHAPRTTRARAPARRRAGDRGRLAAEGLEASSARALSAVVLARGAAVDGWASSCNARAKAASRSASWAGARSRTWPP